MQIDNVLPYKFKKIYKLVYFFSKGDQGIITKEDDFESCEVHPDKHAVMYCFEHNDICCVECAESKHR